MRQAGTFTKRGNAGTAKCESCGKTRQKANIATFLSATSGVCNECYEEAGYENEHYDGGHAEGSEPVKCPLCR